MGKVSVMVFALCGLGLVIGVLPVWAEGGGLDAGVLGNMEVSTIPHLRAEMNSLFEDVGTASKNLSDFLSIDVQRMDLSANGEIDRVIASLSTFIDAYQPGGTIERKFAQLQSQGQALLADLRMKAKLDKNYEVLVAGVSAGCDALRATWNEISALRHVFERNIEELRAKRVFFIDCLRAEMFQVAVAKAQELKKNLVTLNEKVQTILKKAILPEQMAARQ